MKKNSISLLILFSATLSFAEKKEPWYKRLISSIGSEKVTLSTMEFDQLCEAKNKALANNDRFTAIKYLERMSKKCDNLEKLRDIVLELANILFDDSQFTKAALLYDQYLKSYPGHTTDYMLAHYKKILCSFYQTLEIDRDQTMTEKTLELCDTFLNESKDSEYQKDVLSIQGDCTKKLAHHELYIAQNYIIQNRVVSANRRITRIRDTYLTVPDIEPQLLLVEINLADKVGNVKFAHTKREELAQKFPEHQSVVVAQTKKSQNMSHRF